MRSVLVTGATGHVGREVVRHLLAAGTPVVAACQGVDRGRALFDGQVATAKLDFWDRDTWEGALSGIDRLFLVRPPAISDVRRTLQPFVDTARARGVGHVVFLSVAGAERNRVVPHRKVEDHLRAGSEPYTLLRPGFFAQNLESAYRRDIAEDDRIYVPAGRRQPVNWIDTRDIGEVAARVLARPEPHRGQAYTLTGPGPVTWSHVVERLSSVLGRPIRYEPASIPGYVRHLHGRGLPLGAIAVQTTLHALLRFGQGATWDAALERLLGRPGRSLASYVEDHAPLWRREA